ncbi:hypothetical protein ACQP25_33850 [Microtetraspora malaysiensis]|uniref:hypothetical protein n=1 Tax=Microtetraspora malaysiensis TaxID=161358 RepID=UPI003D8C8998
MPREHTSRTGLGPLAIGALHDATGSWTPAVAVLLALLVPHLFTGLASAHDRSIEPRP